MVNERRHAAAAWDETKRPLTLILTYEEAKELESSTWDNEYDERRCGAKALIARIEKHFPSITMHRESNT